MDVATAGEELTSEIDAPVNVNYTADVYQQASLTTNSPVTVNDTAYLTLTNVASSDGGQRAGVTVADVSVGGGVSSNFTAGLSGAPSVGDATGTATSGTVATASLMAKRLNGTYSDTVTGTVQYTDTQLRSQASVSNQTWNISASVNGNTSLNRNDVYSANIRQGGSYAGYGLTSGVGYGTNATLLSGTANAGTSVAMSFDTTSANGVKNDTRVSDILTLSGLNGTNPAAGQVVQTDIFVLQMTYDSSATGLEYVAWNNGTAFVNAISGNSSGISTLYGNGALNESYADYLASNSGLSLSQQLGAFGYYNGEAWAVLDHTGISDGTGSIIEGTNEFAVIPEPSTWAMILSGLGTLVGIQRLRKRQMGV